MSGFSAAEPSILYPDDEIAEVTKSAHPQGSDAARTKVVKQMGRSETTSLNELEAAASAIGRLQRLSLAIRKANTGNSRFSRAVGFTIYDEDFIESTASRQRFEVDFKEYISTVLTHRYRPLDATRKEKLAELITFRRQKFLYAASHQEKLRGSLLEFPISTLQGRENSSPNSPGQSYILPSKPEEEDANNIDGQSESRASTFRQENYMYVPEPTSSVASSQLRVSPVLLRNDNIPPAPAFPQRTPEHECPYCHWILPAKQFLSKRRWKLHIEEDLQPYICLYEECFSPPRMFTSVEEWIKHTNEHHSTQWVCILHQDNNQELPSFNDQEQLKLHLTSCHGKSLSASQMRTLIRLGTKPGIASILQSCPFCEDCSEQSGTRQIQEHIANHLLDLALMSLPWRDDMVEAVEDSDDIRPESDSRLAESFRTSRRTSSNNDDHTSSSTHLRDQANNSFYLPESYTVVLLP